MTATAGTGPGLLPQAPAPVDAVQARLCEHHIGNPDALIRYFGDLRRAVDPALARQFPEFGGKPYPLGRCREIRDAVLALLVERVNAPRCETDGAISAFLRGGGVGKKIWGVLRDSYFQNAIQLGGWYVDVANDTVVAEKPPVEILPIGQVDMVAVRDFRHFAAVAERYWRARVYRNSVFPRIAAFFPLICTYADGTVELGVGSDQITELTRRARFRPSLEALSAFSDPPPQAVSVLAGRAGQAAPPLLAPADDPVACVESCVADRLYDDAGFRQRCVAAYRLVSSPSVSG